VTDERFTREQSSRAVRPGDDADAPDAETPDAPGALRGPPPSERERPDGRRTEHGVRAGPDDEREHPSRRAVLSAVVEHEPGVLSSVAGLFSRRMFNIESLTVGPTADDDFARITVVVDEPTPGVEQVKRQLRGLVRVHEVRELDDSAVERETALVEVCCDSPDAVHSAVETVDGEVVDATPETVTVAVSGSTEHVDRAIERFAAFGLREIARTGATALARGEAPTTEWAPTAEATGTRDADAQTPDAQGERPTDDGRQTRRHTDDD